MNGSVKRQYRVRPFRDSDKEQVYRVFRDSMLYGDNAPRRNALKSKLQSPSSMFFYTIILTGLVLPITAVHKKHLQVLSCLFSSLIAFGFVGYWSLFSSKFSVFCDMAIADDMKDIEQHYKTRPLGDGEEPSPNGFWVAEYTYDGIDGTKSKVVGCVGLDVTTVTEPNCAELRRMFVYPDHQHKGVASALIDTLLAHARARGISRIILHVSEFQPAAHRLYKKYGWVERKRMPLVVEGFSVMMKELVLDL